MEQEPAAPSQSTPSPTSPSQAMAAQATASNASTYAMFCHLSAFAGLFFPFGNVLGPLVVWLVKKDEIPEVDAHGKESINFQLSVTIYTIVSAILVLLLIGIPLLIGLSVFWLVVVILASVRANEGTLYRYPLTIRFLN